MTAEGRLYEVDMRLRPSGNQGPVAVRFDTFVEYHREKAWTWERMALTRARVISGPERLCQAVERAIRDVLTRPSDKAAVLADARTMRERLSAQFPGRDIWDIKFAPGGLVDIEFVAQVRQLLGAQDDDTVLDQNSIGALEKLADAGLVSAQDAAVHLGVQGLHPAVQVRTPHLRQDANRRCGPRELGLDWFGRNALLYGGVTTPRPFPNPSQ